MKYFYITYFALFILSLSACQSNDTTKKTDAKPIFINYEARYLEEEKELRGLAYFKQGDFQETATSIDVLNPTFQGSAMDKQDLGERGSRYIFTKKGPYSPNLNFGFKNESGVLINHEMNMPEMGEISVKEDFISKNKGVTIDWDGALIDSSQVLIIMFSGEDGNSSSLSLRGPSEVSEVVVNASSIKRLALGRGQVFLVKKQVKKTRNQNQTITASIEYYTKPIELQVVE